MALRNDVIATATPHEDDDVSILAAELGLADDPVAVDVLRRSWRAGFYRAAIEYDKRFADLAAHAV